MKTIQKWIICPKCGETIYVNYVTDGTWILKKGKTRLKKEAKSP
jgi:ribosomal protein L37AE/L43A